MITVDASIPCLAPPAWAILQRKLLEVMEEAVHPFLAKYTNEDGTLIWRTAADGPYGSRDGADDFYEAFWNWPLLYLLGGGDDLLDLAERQWEAITGQLTGLGLVYKEYERGYDQFHQAESYIYFYLLCLADPANRRYEELARRFAGLYLGEDAEAPNYDAQRGLIRAPHNGSGGPRAGLGDGPPSYAWSPGMARYGLPFADVPGVSGVEDLKDPARARLMGQAMEHRMGRGDVVANLGVTSLVTNAYLLTGEEKYRRWVVDYVDAWVARAEENGGLLPDNVGLSGQVGEYVGGKWYGGLYGWTWPHGFYNIGMAAIVAAANALLLTGDRRYLDLPRAQMDHLRALGVTRDAGTVEMSLREHWIGQLGGGREGEQAFLVPYRHGDGGWFDYQPLSPIFPTAVWALSMEQADWARLEDLRRRSPYDWRQVAGFRTKEESGHEQPWLRFLAGENPAYPEAILRATYGQVCRRLALIRQDSADLRQVHIHHWQDLNPVVTEALVQLTLGAPQIIYNGGLLQCRLRYFDGERKRPGLPLDVAALVTTLEDDRTVLHLVNLSPFVAREVIVQGGAFGEHRLISASYAARTSVYPGEIGRYAAPDPRVERRTVAIEGTRVRVCMPPATEIVLDLRMARFAAGPAYAGQG